MNNDNDRVTLVNEHDEVIGEMDKIQAHRGKGKLHRAVSVYLFWKNKQSGSVELLVQQRSTKKIVAALQWANTACGNVWPGESYEDCAKRRLSVELGIDAQAIQLQPIEKFQYQVQCNEEFSEHEMDQVFASWHSGDVSPNVDEVAATDWVLWEDLKNSERRTELNKDWAPWLEIMMKNEKIIEKLSQYIEG